MLIDFTADGVKPQVRGSAKPMPRLSLASLSHLMPLLMLQLPAGLCGLAAVLLPHDPFSIGGHSILRPHFKFTAGSKGCSHPCPRACLAT